MGHTKHTLSWRNILCAGVALISLSACAGADIPYIVDNNKGNPGGGGVSTGSGPGTSKLEGCAIPFNSELILETKGGGSLGEIKSDPRKVSPIPLRFGGSTVALFAQEFPTIDLIIENAPAAMRIQQKEGSSAQGSYDASSGKVEINNVVFIVTLLDKTSLNPMGLAPIEMPPLTLTSGSVDQAGSFGSISKQGAPLGADKSLTLVGGLAIPSSFPSDDLQGASLVVSFAGSVADLPASGNCSGSFSSGLQFKSVVSTPNGEVEREVANNTLDFGRVYVPQAGVDAAAAGDPRFFASRKLRVKNGTDSDVQANLQSTENFKISPSGSVTLAAGASKDFQIEFSAKPQSDYSEQKVPASKELSASLSFGPGSVKLAGEARRASAELMVAGTEEGAPSTIDLGLVPAAVQGSGANAKLDCKPLPGKKIPLVSRTVEVSNSGIRPLQVWHIQNAVDALAQAKDPFCAGFPTEFNRVALSQEGSAQCKTIQQNGKTYITDECKLPDSNGKLRFKVVYLPVNASSVRAAVDGKPTPDTGSLSIVSDDPRFDAAKGKESFKLNLSAGVSPDQSDVLRLAKEGSKTLVTNGGNVRVNIPNAVDSSISQKLIVMNYLDQPLSNVQISVDDPAHFEVTGAPSQVPAMPSAGTEPGKAEFTVKFTKTAGMTEGDLAARLKLKFTPQGGSESSFEANLIGSVDHKVLTGDVRMRVDFISSFFDTNLLKSAPIDTDDFRSGKFDAFRPGDLEFVFTEVPGQDGIRHVTMKHKLNVDPYNPDLLETILSLTPEDRKGVLRVYSTRLSGYPGGIEDANHDGLHDCTEPQDLHSAFLPSHCSFFYYIFGTKPGQDGIYNDETGELFFPDVKLRLLNPYHATVLDYSSNLATDTELKASISTFTFDGPTAGGLPLVPDPSISSSDIAVPDDIVKGLNSSADQQCPAGWVPWDDAKRPTFTCFVRPASPYYLRGFPARPLENGQYSIVLSMLSKIGPSGPPNNVPSFMANGRMWVAIMGRLIPSNP